MATIANFGNGTGVVYVTGSDGTTVVAAVPNKFNDVVSLVRGAKSNNGVAGVNNIGLSPSQYRYFLNDSGSASIDTLSGDEITDWLVGRGFEGAFPSLGVSVSGASVNTLPPLSRKGSLQFVKVRTAQGGVPSDVNNIEDITATDKFVVGDCVVVYIDSVIYSGSETYPLRLIDGVGNLRLNGNMILENATHHIMLRFDGTNWVEVFRNPTSGIPSVQQARSNGFSVNGDGQNTALIVSGGGLVVNPNTASRIITLANPSSVNTLSSDFNVTVADVKEGDFYVVYIKGNYVGGAGDIRLFGTAITGTIVPSNTSFTRPVAVMCFYTSGQWLFWSTVDITRYMLDFDLSLTPKYAKATYDFAVNTGAAATYNIGTIPAGSLVDIDNAIILTKTALTSAGSAQVGIGLGADTDAIDNFRNYTAAPYNAVNATMKANNTIAAKSQFVASDTNITLTISTAALTAGKVEIYVPYTKVV